MPTWTVESGRIICKLNENRITCETDEKSSATEAASIGHHRDKTNHVGPKEKNSWQNLLFNLQISNPEAPTDFPFIQSFDNKDVAEEVNKNLTKGLDHIPELIVKKFAETDFKMQLVIIVLLTNLGGFLNAFCMKRGRKLSLRQQLIAIHPKIREVNDGNILSVEHDSCRVQFDSPELGVEHVTSQGNGHSGFGRPGVYTSSGHLENVTSPANMLANPIKVSKWRMLCNQRNKLGSCPAVQVNAKTAVPNVDSAHPTAKDQPLTIAHIQGREADTSYAMSSTKDVEDSFIRAVEALNSIDKLQFTPDIRMPEQVPSELITSCIATLLMIQVWPEGRESIPDFWSRIAAIQRPAY
ncbi:hypothetical protein V6N11_082512 [Hibiscus sabdariffa]|uniref:Uncharacterized protein n=1 Tax=Hibiscus sabdariffa TaxID=183260 RepID=A0ABR2N8W6_9ROSI